VAPSARTRRQWASASARMSLSRRSNPTTRPRHSAGWPLLSMNLSASILNSSIKAAYYHASIGHAVLWLYGQARQKGHAR